MNTFFESFFSDYDFSSKETAVCCPFEHHTSTGQAYIETNPSAHINLMKGVFHCKVCDQGYSELGFISKILGMTYENSAHLSKLFKGTEDTFTWNAKHLTDNRRSKAQELGISLEVIEELKLKTEYSDDIAFPVFMYGKVVDVRSYRPEDRANKIKSRTGAMNGLVIPFDIWTKTPPSKWTIICAGEKDMAVARSHGFNAITLTGGEKALPAFINPFINRKIAICYDNDEPGIAGAKSLASYLQPYAEQVKVITGFHEVCKERGEDITDFFVKYGKSKADLVKYINEAPVFTAEEAREVIRKKVPLITLGDASKPQYVNRMVQSEIQVTASFEKTFKCPSAFTITKLTNSSSDPRYNLMNVGESRTWELNESSCQDILKLIDSNLTEKEIVVNRKEILGIALEKDTRTEVSSVADVYSCQITDLFESNAMDTVATEVTAYSLRNRLESGKKYTITYKMVQHPFKGQINTVIVLDVILLRH